MHLATENVFARLVGAVTAALLMVFLINLEFPPKTHREEILPISALLFCL